MPQFLALTSAGVEPLLADEIQLLGAEQVVHKPDGVYFSADLATAYDICLWSRFATRILLLISEQEVNTAKQLYQASYSVDWSQWFAVDSTLAIDFVGKSQEIRNSQFGALTIKDAIVDKCREQTNERPLIDKYNADIRIQGRLKKQNLALYLDFSGRSLFQRGYRQHSGSAPLKEHLAAAIVKRSGWLNRIETPLVDPMCGSGTLLIEAVSMALGQAPGLTRDFWGFEAWLGHDNALFEQRIEAAQQQEQQKLEQVSAITAYGFDIDARVLKTAKQNVSKAGLSNLIELQCRDINKLTNKYEQPGTIMFNPPYGERIGELPELVENFVLLGQNLKQHFVDWQLAIFTANTDLLPLLKLSSRKRYKFANGPLACQLALYQLDDKQVVGFNSGADFKEQDSAFANRLKKNLKSLKGWLKQQAINCYRVYDADIPEYNVAIDIYGDYVVIHEYAAPKNIPPEKTAKRLQEVVYFAPIILSVPTDKVVLKTREKQKGKNQYQKHGQSGKRIVVQEYQAKLYVNLWDYLDTGLFLDHRKTRQLVASKVKGKRFLNLFAYTGSVSVQAALAGAQSVTTVDMSKTYLQWAQDNFALNQLKGSQYRFEQADCLAWLKQNKQQFDVIFIDPPTFSNSKRMEDSFDVQRDHIAVIQDALSALAEQGEIIFTNNKRHFKMDHQALAELGLTAKELSEQTRDVDFKRNKHIHNSWLITRK